MSKRIVLVTPPSHSHRTAEENLGIGYLASALRLAGFEVHIIDGWLGGYTIQEIAEAIYCLNEVLFIGISCYRYSLDDVSQLITAVKNHNNLTPIVVGGYGPTFHEDDFISCGADYVLRGEAEQTIVQLARALYVSGDLLTVGNLVWRYQGHIVRNLSAAGILDIDALPFPDRDTVASSLRLKNPLHIATSRGCEGYCKFCSIISFMKEMSATPRWRFRSISSIVDEIEQLHDRYGVNCFKFVDDSFIEPPRDASWAEAFALELQRRNLAITFRTQVRADRLNNNLVSALHAAGWFATSIGIENGSPTALRRMGKSTSVDDNIMALELLTKHGIYIQMGMILFDDRTTMQELQENRSFLQMLNWPVTKGIFTEMYAAEGTAFTKILKRRQQLSENRGGNYSYANASKEVSAIRESLRLWHRSHSELYDQAINPISAPKVISPSGYSEYHKICMELYNLDVDFFGTILEVASCGDITDIESATIALIAKETSTYNRIGVQLESIDRRYGLFYDADPNPFL